MQKTTRPQIWVALLIGSLTHATVYAGPHLPRILLSAISGDLSAGCEIRSNAPLRDAIDVLVPRALDVLAPRASRLSLPEDRLVLMLQSGANDGIWDFLSQQGARESSLILAETLSRAEIVKALSGARIFASDAQLNLLDLAELVLAKSFFVALNAKNFTEAIRIYDENLPATLRSFVSFRQQLAFCLNRRNGMGDRDRAVDVLQGLLGESLPGTLSETLSLLACIEKDRYEDSLRRGEPRELWLPHLQKAVDYYLQAFRHDPGNYYPGGNAVELLLVIGTAESVQQASDLAPFVQGALGRFSPLESTDYWVLATSLQLALIRKNFHDSEVLLKRLLAQDEPVWMFETTLASLDRVEQVVGKLARGGLLASYLPSDHAKVSEAVGRIRSRIREAPVAPLVVTVSEPLKANAPKTQGLMLDQEIDLVEEARLSSFESRLQELQAHSRGVIGIHEFLRRFRGNPHRGYLLGLTSEGHRSVYEALARNSNLETWWKAYASFGLDGSSEAGMSSFMEQITAEQKPIVFLVPRNLFHASTAANHTAREMDWILRDSKKRSRDVHFVLGGYQIYDEVFARDLQSRRGYDQSVDFLSAALGAFTQRHWPIAPQ